MSIEDNFSTTDISDLEIIFNELYDYQLTPNYRSGDNKIIDFFINKINSSDTFRSLSEVRPETYKAFKYSLKKNDLVNQGAIVAFNEYLLENEEAISLGDVGAIIDREDLEMFMSERFLIISKCIGNFIKLKSSENKDLYSKRFYHSDRFAFKVKERKKEKVNNMKMHFQHQFKPAERNLVNFLPGQTVYNTISLQRYSVRNSQHHLSEMDVCLMYADGTYGPPSTCLKSVFRSSINEIVSTKGAVKFASNNGFVDSERVTVKIGDWVRLNLASQFSIMTDAGWKYDSSLMFESWWKLLSGNYAVIVDLVKGGEFAILNFKGKDDFAKSGFDSFPFLVDVKNLVAVSEGSGKFVNNDFEKEYEEMKRKKAKEQAENEDLAKGPYNLNHFENKIIFFANLQKELDGNYGIVTSVDNRLGRLSVKVYNGRSTLNYILRQTQNHLNEDKIVIYSDVITSDEEPKEVKEHANV